MGYEKKKRQEVISTKRGHFAPVLIWVQDEFGSPLSYYKCPVCEEYEKYSMIIDISLPNGGEWQCKNCGTRVDPHLISLPKGSLAIGSVHENI